MIRTQAVHDNKDNIPTRFTLTVVDLTGCRRKRNRMILYVYCTPGSDDTSGHQEKEKGSSKNRSSPPTQKGAVQELIKNTGTKKSSCYEENEEASFDSHTQRRTDKEVIGCFRHKDGTEKNNYPVTPVIGARFF